MKAPSWSFSRLLVFEQCPYRYKLQHLDKIPDLQPKTAADRGTAIHQEAEDYVLSKGNLTHNLRHFEQDLAALRTYADKGLVVCEEEWGFDRDWRISDWKLAWLRLKCDAVCWLTKNHLVVVDYKTGKRFGNEIKHARQLQLYALCSLIRYPAIEKVTCELWYLDQNELASFEMHPKQLNKYLKIFDRDGRAVTDCKKFEPRANIDSCKYCPYHVSKQGDCPYGVDMLGRPGAAQPVRLFKKAKASKFDDMFAQEAEAFR